MKLRLVSRGLPLLVLFLASVPIALASSTWYVDGITGSDKNNCKSPQTACKTIRHAISLASSGDSIMIASATYTENLRIPFDLNMIGSGASTTIIDGGATRHVISIPESNVSVALSKMMITNGAALCGGGIANYGTLTITDAAITRSWGEGDFGAIGGGICNYGTLTLNHSTVSENGVRAAYEGDGGGIYNLGTLTVNDSTLSGNFGRTSYLYGGAIFNGGTAAINRSTLSGNGEGLTGGGFGGAIYNYQGAIVINNSTLSLNGAGNAGGGIENDYSGTISINNSTISGNGSDVGGGIYSSSGTVSLQNSIVANNQPGSNCSGTMTSEGYNLSSDASCNFDNTGDLNSTNPRLGRLQNNGGPTQTHALLDGSPAIDVGNPAGCTDGQGHVLKTDQRGRPRPDHEDTGGCDMGAFERQRD